MTGILLARREDHPGAPSDPLPPLVGAWRAHWPMSVVFLGLPLWWVLGLMTLMPIAMSLVMLDQLLRRRDVVLPRGFALWAVFLVWVALGVFVLWVDAPGAVPGGGPARLLVFLSHSAWYFAGTVSMLWVTNLTEAELPTAWIHQLLGALFVVTAVGGLLGVLVPLLSFPSVVELLLPSGIRANALVQAMVHPATADIEDVLGRLAPRPKAPFAYSNSWGSVLALSLPFFLVAWFRGGRRWQRVLGPVILLAAAVPVVYSLNRGLWVCLVLGAVFLLGLQAHRRRLAPLVVTVVLLAALGVAFASSPLGTIFTERLNHQHSNERRGELLVQTVRSTATGSPVVGFGSTRDVQGNFESIAGGATPDCSACGVPPLGTQGQLWGVIFAQGFVGTALFLMFFLNVFSRCWRCRTTTESLCAVVLLFFAVQLFVYDTLDFPILVVMIAVGALSRERFLSGADRPAWGSATAALARLRAVAPVLGLLAVVGAAVGATIVAMAPAAYSATVKVLPTDVPVDVGGPVAATAGEKDEERTVDTEAALVVSEVSLRRVVGATGTSSIGDLRRRIRVTAPPRTNVLTIKVQEPTAAGAERVARQVASAYLTTRRDLLVVRKDRALTVARRQLDELWARSGPTKVDEAALSGPDARAARNQAQDLIRRLALSSTDAGEVTTAGAAAKLSGRVEVLLTSGAGLGLLLGALVVTGRSGRHRSGRDRRVQRLVTSRR